MSSLPNEHHVDNRPESFYIGWDVGGWNCDKNGKSRDAIVILDSSRSIVGKPWRGNLRTDINDSTNTTTWVQALFSRCEAQLPNNRWHATLAIDTPLGFSKEFANLVSGMNVAEPVEMSNSNPYLFRQTERYLFDHGLTPLSAVKDMIGSQATKGMHVLAKFAPISQSCGVWTNGSSLVAIEAYPSSCKSSVTVQRLQRSFPALDHEDKRDALTCALLAYLFTSAPDTLAGPDAKVPSSEGWIWVPKDGLRS